jgi:hypothetical protein
MSANDGLNVGARWDNERVADDGTTYVMSGIEYTYDELIAALDAEAATLDPEQWVGGWDAHEYLIDALLVGTIEKVQMDHIDREGE